jgi:hypothetical protein
MKIASDPFQNHVNVRHVRLVVHYSFLDLNPCVRFERENLRADHQLSVMAIALQQQRRGRRPLEAQNLLEIENARKIGCTAEFFGGWDSTDRDWLHSLMSNQVMKLSETSKAHNALQQQKQCPTLNHKPIHRSPP